jgi:hypothetical protein
MVHVIGNLLHHLFKKQQLRKMSVRMLHYLKSEENRVEYKVKMDGPLPETFGLTALLEEKIIKNMVTSPTGGTIFEEQEDELFDPFDLDEPDLSLSTTSAWGTS